MTEIIIIGAGMAGLLAGRILKMRGHKVTILEKQKELPNNHNAVLRFRSNIVSDITGIPFTKVQMIKATVPYLNPVAEALAYSYKTTGTYSSDRSITGGLTVAERWIAPPDFIKQLSEGLDIKFNYDFFPLTSEINSSIISTIPMPALINHLDYNYSQEGFLQDFNSKKGMVAKAYIKDCYAFASLYVPSPKYPAMTRISLTADELAVELNQDCVMAEAENAVSDALYLLGFERGSSHLFEPDIMIGKIQLYHQAYAKIEPINDLQRKKFMAWATDKHNIYSLGRYATWRPGLLLDDLVKDIKLIEGWILKGNNYDVRRAR